LPVAVAEPVKMVVAEPIQMVVAEKEEVKEL